MPARAMSNPGYSAALMTGEQTERRWRRWGRAVLNILYPLQCPGCAVHLPAGFFPGDFCTRCEEEFRPVEAPFCQICAEPFPGNIPGDFTCPNCAGRQQAYDFAIPQWLSRGPIREVIHRFKYGGSIVMRLPIARLMTSALSDPRLAGADWLLVPVPLHPRKKRERRYNQSAELARTLSRLSGLPWCDALSRVRYTDSQAGLDREDRLKNLRGAFTVKTKLLARFPGRQVLLIDDVLTTGATAHECALTLKKTGIKKVVVLAAARG